MRKITYKGEDYELINIQIKPNGTFIIFVIDKNNKLDWNPIENLSCIDVHPEPV